MEKNRFDFKVEVINDGEKVFEGSFYDWLDINDGGLDGIIYIIDCYFPLITKEKKSVTIEEFHSGVWTVIRI